MLTGDASPSQRRPRLLWASVYCLLDTSSGASMAVRQMLLQLLNQGYEIQVLGAAVFDDERGTAGLQGQWQEVQKSKGGWVALVDEPLEHRLYVTASTKRDLMTCAEESAWLSLYQQSLDLFKPDVVFYYGGQPLDFLISGEARARGVPSAFFLVNGHYSKARWCRDVDLVLTDSQATAQMYRDKLGVEVKAVGAFIDPARVLAQERSAERILFVNPTLEKGAALVIRLAMMLEKRRPDIVFEVVESRGKWSDVLRTVSAAYGSPRETLDNVVVTANTSDMRPVYGRARLLLAPSLWWESGARVLAEAMLNGIPAIITSHGGSPEMVQDGGLTLKLGAVYHEAPFGNVPADEALQSVVQRIETLFDDQDQYAQLAARALRVGQTRHQLGTSTARLVAALQPLLDQCAGDADMAQTLRSWHRHGLDERVFQPPSIA